MKTSPAVEQPQIYRKLQRHLDRQPVGFPSVRSGADLRLLACLFTPEQAELALHLSYKPRSVSQIVSGSNPPFSPDRVQQLLDSMFVNGAIGRKDQQGVQLWYLMPLVVGMYEGQDGKPSLRFLKEVGAYMNSLAYGKSLLAVKPSQMRTIPVNKSIKIEHHVAAHDQVQGIVESAQGPFVILNCICRAGAKLKRKPCSKTERTETCLAIGNSAAQVRARNHGREISKDEALAILARNEEEGLVFQPSGARDPEFICSCCGCCCGMLGMQKLLPHPVDFWSSGFYAELDQTLCHVCGKCVSRCQVNAITIGAAGGKAIVNLSRCIGCGLCVTTCPPQALRLVKKDSVPELPKDEEQLYEQINRHKMGPVGEWLMMLKVALGLRQ